MIPSHPQHGQMKHVHGVGTAHQHVSDAGDDIHVDVPVHTVLQQDIPVMAVDAAEKNGFHI